MLFGPLHTSGVVSQIDCENVGDAPLDSHSGNGLVLYALHVHLNHSGRVELVDGGLFRGLCGGFRGYWYF